jgi:hypothetical protein
MLAVILFPAISASDDLGLMLNPAETTSWQRRDFQATSVSSKCHAIEALPVFAVVEFICCERRLDAVNHTPLLTVDWPALHPIQVRPPPSV